MNAAPATTYASASARDTSLTSEAAKLIRMLAIEFRQTITRRAEMIGRIIFFIILMLIFSRLWQAVLGAAANGASSPASPAGSGPSDMLWYLAGTEWIALSVPMTHLDFERDIRSGDICYRLGRPVSYIWSRLAEGTGAMLARMIAVGLTALVFTRLLAGAWPSGGWAVLMAIPYGLVAGTLLLMFQCIIGLSAVWMEDVSPGYWVWQKLMFFFGGLMFPITVYPNWMQAIAEWTPFYPLLCGTGMIASGGHMDVASGFAIRLAAWVVIAALLLAWVFRRAEQRVEINGG
jgi:ABC-2 type transport system permease protein